MDNKDSQSLSSSVNNNDNKTSVGNKENPQDKESNRVVTELLSV